MLLRLRALACTSIEFAEAQVAVRDEGAHAARLGEGQRLAVVSLAALGVEPVGMVRDVAEQVPRMGREPVVLRRGFDRAVAQAPRLEPLRSAKSTVTSLRSPSSALLEVRIFSARCLGV